MMRLWAVPYSTNVERVSLALAHKGLEAERAEVPYEDRTRIRELSGQELVPVLEHDGRVIADSPVILRYLEELRRSRRCGRANRRAGPRSTSSWTGSTGCGSGRRT